MLNVSGDARKLSLDPRMLKEMNEFDEKGNLVREGGPIYPDASPYTEGKVVQVARNVARIHEAEEPVRGVQLVFLDVGTPKSEGKTDEEIEAARQAGQQLTAAEQGVMQDLYRVIKDRMEAQGVPEHEIAFIQDYKSADEREDLFDSVRKGEIRVLIGHTDTMGVGVNVQDRIAALHHIDAPWRPRDLEQREGRAIRQGNKVYGPVIVDGEVVDPGRGVQVYQYVQEGSFDEFMWQGLREKARPIKELMRTKDSGIRKVQEIDEFVLDVGNTMAAASANPLVRRHVEVKNTVNDLKLDKKAHDLGVKESRSQVDHLETTMGGRRAALPRMEQDAAYVRGLPDAKFRAIIGGEEYDKSGEAGEALADAVRKLKFDPSGAPLRPLGVYKGFGIGGNQLESGYRVVIARPETEQPYSIHFPTKDDVSPEGIMRRINNQIKDVPERARETGEKLASEEQTLEAARNQTTRRWERADELLEAEAELADVEARLQRGETGVDENKVYGLQPLPTQPWERTHVQALEERLARRGSSPPKQEKDSANLRGDAQPSRETAPESDETGPRAVRQQQQAVAEEAVLPDVGSPVAIVERKAVIDSDDGDAADDDWVPDWGEQADLSDDDDDDDWDGSMVSESPVSQETPPAEAAPDRHDEYLRSLAEAAEQDPERYAQLRREIGEGWEHTTLATSGAEIAALQLAVEQDRKRADAAEREKQREIKSRKLYYPVLVGRSDKMVTALFDKIRELGGVYDEDAEGWRLTPDQLANVGVVYPLESTLIPSTSRKKVERLKKAREEELAELARRMTPAPGVGQAMPPVELTPTPQPASEEWLSDALREVKEQKESSARFTPQSHVLSPHLREPEPPAALPAFDMSGLGGSREGPATIQQVATLRELARIHPPLWEEYGAAAASMTRQEADDNIADLSRMVSLLDDDAKVETVRKLDEEGPSEEAKREAERERAQSHMGTMFTPPAAPPVAPVEASNDLERVVAELDKDRAYRNAMVNSDEQNARIEHGAALTRVMTGLLREKPELYKQYVDDESFRNRLTEQTFDATYTTVPPEQTTPATGAPESPTVDATEPEMGQEPEPEDEDDWKLDLPDLSPDAGTSPAEPGLTDLGTDAVDAEDDGDLELPADDDGLPDLATDAVDAEDDDGDLELPADDDEAQEEQEHGLTDLGTDAVDAEDDGDLELPADDDGLPDLATDAVDAEDDDGDLELPADDDEAQEEQEHGLTDLAPPDAEDDDLEVPADDPQEEQAEADVATAMTRAEETAAEGSDQKAEAWLLEKVNEGGQTNYNVWHVEADGTRNQYGSAKTKRKAEALLKRLQTSSEAELTDQIGEAEAVHQDAPPQLPKVPKMEAPPKMEAKRKVEAFDWSKDDMYGGAKPPPLNKKKATTTKARKKRSGHPWLSRDEQRTLA